MVYKYDQILKKDKNKLFLIGVVVAYALTLAMSMVIGASAAKQSKVDVCHLEGNGSYHLINISEKAVDAHLAHGDEVAGVFPFTEDCSMWVLMETVEVPANDIDGVSSIMALESGEHYMLKASGTAFAGDTIDFDAQYSLTNRIAGDTWTDSVSGYEGYGPTLLDLFVDGGDVDWGAYNSDHSYWYAYMGNGSPVNFWVYDVYYPNNTGSLMVDIFELAN